MTCEPTQTPDDIDIPALREKYRQERDKRLRPEGQAQYVRTAGDFADQYEVDPHTPVEPRQPISEDLDVAILGAGWSGLLAAYHLKQAGVTTFRNIDWPATSAAAGTGTAIPASSATTTPTATSRCSRRRGYMPTKKFADGVEIYEYVQRDREAVRPVRQARCSTRWSAACAGTRRSSAGAQHEPRRRHPRALRGHGLRSPESTEAAGHPRASRASRGTRSTRRAGTTTTPAAASENPVLDKLADKRVAIVGTGATAIQVVPHLGRHAKQLYVVQRTPSSVDERPNPPTDPEWVKSAEARLAEGAAGELPPRRDARALAPGRAGPDLRLLDRAQPQHQSAGWRPGLASADARAVHGAAGAGGLPGDGAAAPPRRQHRQGQGNGRGAEALLPLHVQAAAARATSYYETFNRPNVKLLDVSSTRGLERMTEKGIVANGVEYPVDCVIFASGFEVSSELSRRWGIDVVEGRNGVSIYDHWADGYKTLHGMTTHGFPEPVLHPVHSGRVEREHPRDVSTSRPITSPTSSRKACGAEPARSSAARRRRTSGSRPSAKRRSTSRVPARVHARLLQQRGRRRSSAGSSASPMGRASMRSTS